MPQPTTPCHKQPFNATINHSTLQPTTPRHNQLPHATKNHSTPQTTTPRHKQPLHATNDHTTPQPPPTGSTGALLATEEVLSEAGVQRGRLRGGRSREGNFLKKLLTGEVDSETTSGFETGSSTCNTPSPLSITLLSSCSPTSQSSPYSISSPSCSPYSHSPTPDSMETSTLPVDSLLTDGFGLDADLLIDEKGSLNMQLDWQDDSFKLVGVGCW